VLLALWFVLCRQLSGEWSVNEQYSYGWFVPFFALFLFWLRWEGRPQGESRKEKVGSRRRAIAIAIGVVALFVLFPVRVFEIANPDWRPLDWIHAAAVITITFAVLYLAGGWAWTKHFSFPVLFFFVAVPWISPIEQPVVQGLMRTVAAVATEALSLCGIPAQLEGSLIRVSSGLVGVNEACSGVRSLQTSLMIGLLFGELKRLSVGKRVALVLGAIAIAIVANFGRAFFLVWVAATRSISAVSEWHDFAGYTIVAVVFCGSLGMAALLGRRGSKVEKADAPTSSSSHFDSLAPARSPFGLGPCRSAPAGSILLPTFYFLISFVWLFAVEIGTEFWYRAHEKNLAARAGWNVRPPEKALGFHEIKIDENVQQTLRFDVGREVTWKTDDAEPPGSPTTNYLFFFRWSPGSSSVLRARAHRPDICLPNVGWRQIADRGTRTYFARDEVTIAARHISFSQFRGNVVAHTFFCLQEDKIRPNEPRPDLQLAAGVQPDWSVTARVRVVRNGIRNLGQQVLEIVLLSSPPMEEQIAEDKFTQLLREIVVEEK
jgi:exosortase